MIEKGKTYHRHNPGGSITTVDVNTDADVKYHQSLIEKGYTYELISKANYDFELPELNTVPTKPRIHISDTGCESCSA